MKRQSIFAAFAAVAVGSLFSPGAKATITDSLTGPSTSDATVSALTADPGTDGRGNANPYVSSSSGKSFGNSRFGAGYNAFSYSGVFTNGSAEGYQSLAATATVFGDTKTALNAYVYGITNGPSQSANVYGYVYALGNLVKSGTHTGGDFNGAYYLTGWNQDLWNSGLAIDVMNPANSFRKTESPLTATADPKRTLASDAPLRICWRTRFGALSLRPSVERQRNPLLDHAQFLRLLLPPR